MLEFGGCHCISPDPKGSRPSGWTSFGGLQVLQDAPRLTASRSACAFIHIASDCSCTAATAEPALRRGSGDADLLGETKVAGAADQLARVPEQADRRVSQRELSDQEVDGAG
jgi:hypothetical protein